MARLPYAEIPERTPKLNIFRLLANSEPVFKPFMRYGLALLRDTTLDPVVREEYEWVQHEAIGRAAGMTDGQIAACCDGGDDLVLRFTEEVVRDATPSDATFAAMTERFSAQEIIELLLVIGQYMGLARVMATAQIDIDPPIGATALSADV